MAEVSTPTAPESMAQELPCVFRSALFAQLATCSLMAKRSLAEREVLMCRQAPAHMNCETLERLFLERATFPLHLKPGSPMTHATVMRLQAGGLQGLQQAVATQTPEVHGMVQQAQRQFGSLSDLPWADIVAHMLAWQPRRRSPGKSSP